MLLSEESDALLATRLSPNMNLSTMMWWGSGDYPDPLLVAGRELQMARVHSEEHPDTLTSMSNLAFTYIDQG
jgi:hypothetical protein